MRTALVLVLLLSVEAEAQITTDPNAGMDWPHYSAPIVLQADLNDSHDICTVIAPTIGQDGRNTIKTYKGGLNIILGGDTPIPQGTKSDIYGAAVNIYSHQSQNDITFDGLLGWAYNITSTNGAQIDGFGGVAEIGGSIPPVTVQPSMISSAPLQDSTNLYSLIVFPHCKPALRTAAAIRSVTAGSL